jgi:hypothetical protein
MNRNTIFAFVAGLLVAAGIVFTAVRPEPAPKHVIAEWPITVPASTPPVSPSAETIKAVSDVGILQPSPARSPVATTTKTLKPSKPAPTRPARREIAKVKPTALVPALALAPAQIGPPAPVEPTAPTPPPASIRAPVPQQVGSATMAARYPTPNHTVIGPFATVMVNGTPSQFPEPYPSLQLYWIAFNDGVICVAVRYWVRGHTFCYVTRDHKLWQTLVNTVNRARTEELNREHNVTLYLPPQSGFITLRE